MSGSLPTAAFLAFATVNSVTPGPNVILLAGSGGLFGFRRTVPHLLGICFGFPVMVLLVQLGLDGVLRRLPWLLTALTAGSLAYVLWLAARLVKSGFGATQAAHGRSRPMTFMEAVLFQWINGKAWQIALMTAALFASPLLARQIAQAASYGVIILVSGGLWVVVGREIARYLENPRIRAVYYCALAAALLLSTWPKGLAQLSAAFHAPVSL